MPVAKNLGLACVTVLVALVPPGQAPPSGVWERRPAPGILYRMQVEAEPGRVVHALRFDCRARQYWATSSLATDEVYDLKPTNGRATMSQMILNADALGGVNGDFFQFGDDPGGDPTGLMVRNGELISHPTRSGVRGAAIGWGQDAVQIAPRPTWTASVGFGSGVRMPIAGLNEYAREAAVTLATPASGYATSKAPALYVIVKTEAALLKPKGEVRGVVVGTREGTEKIPVLPGTMVLMGRGAPAEALRRVPLGASATIRTNVEGFDFGRIDNVIGGGPVLVHAGNVAYRAEDPRHPRTAMGLDKDGNVWYAVIDGRQPMSVGATLKETAEIMRRLGCVEAINLDGGGSSSISLLGVTLNRPSGGSERAIANGILWHGPRPKPSGRALSIEAPETLSLSQTAHLRVLGPDGAVASQGVVWTCQGDAWVDQEGTLRPVKEGEAIVQALVEGAIVERKILVTK